MSELFVALTLLRQSDVAMGRRVAAALNIETMLCRVSPLFAFVSGKRIAQRCFSTRCLARAAAFHEQLWATFDFSFDFSCVLFRFRFLSCLCENTNHTTDTSINICMHSFTKAPILSLECKHIPPISLMSVTRLLLHEYYHIFYSRSITVAQSQSLSSIL